MSRFQRNGSADCGISRAYNRGVGNDSDSGENLASIVWMHNIETCLAIVLLVAFTYQ